LPVRSFFLLIFFKPLPPHTGIRITAYAPGWLAQGFRLIFFAMDRLPLTRFLFEKQKPQRLLQPTNCVGHPCGFKRKGHAVKGDMLTPLSLRGPVLFMEITFWTNRYFYQAFVA